MKFVVHIVTAVLVTVRSQPDYNHAARCCGSMGSVLQLGVAVVPAIVLRNEMDSFHITAL